MKRKSLIVTILTLMATVFAFAGVACKSKPSTKQPTFYTVSFDTLGGNDIPSVQVEQGQCIEEPETPVKVGYDFNCWYYDFAEFDFSTPVNEDMELIANWSAKTDVAYSINVFVSDEDKTADYTDFFGVMKATTGQTVNVSSVATRILESLSGYYLDTKNANSVVEATIAGDGSTVFNLYFEELVAEGNVLACYSKPITGQGFTAVLSNEEGFVREGEQAVLKVTADEPLSEIPFDIIPENKDWSSYDYISYYVYNNSNVTVWTENGYVLFRNQWNLITLELSDANFDDLMNVELFSNKIVCQWNVLEAGMKIDPNSAFYISSIKGNNFKKTYTEGDNVAYKFEEEVGSLPRYWTLLGSDYYDLAPAEINVNNQTHNMTRVSIAMSTADAKYHTIHLAKLLSNDTSIRGFSFDVYNENDFAIYIADNEIPAKTLKNVTVRRSQIEYFGTDGFQLYALTENDEYLPSGASYCLGNVVKNPIGSKIVSYSVKAYVQNGLGGVYEDKTAEFDFGECTINEFGEVNIQFKAEELTPDKHYLDVLYEGSVLHVYEVLEGTQFVVYYTYTDYVAPNYYRVEGRGQLSISYSTAYDEEVCSYKIYDTNSWTNSEEDKGTQLFFTDEAWQAYENALAQNPDIGKVVFYVMEPTCGLTNCAGQCRLLDGEVKDGKWDIIRVPLYKEYFSRVELTVEQFTKIYNGYGYYLDFACWAEGHYVYLSGLYFE